MDKERGEIKEGAKRGIKREDWVSRKRKEEERRGIIEDWVRREQR